MKNESKRNGHREMPIFLPNNPPAARHHWTYLIRPLRLYLSNVHYHVLKETDYSFFNISAGLVLAIFIVWEPIMRTAMVNTSTNPMNMSVRLIGA